MIRLLAFVSIWYGLKSLISCLLQDKPNAFKIAGNITSMLNGFMLIISPLLIRNGYYDILPIILDLNIAYNIVDFINTSLMYRLHHIGVFICDYLIWTQPIEIIRYPCMCIYSLIEMSNIFVWINYHKIQSYNFKPKSSDIKLQLCWFAGFRISATILMIILSWEYALLNELIVFALLSVGTVFWGYGMYKKIA
jgi:hypothetical protein